MNSSGCSMSSSVMNEANSFLLFFLMNFFAGVVAALFFCCFLASSSALSAVFLCSMYILVRDSFLSS